MFLGSNTSYVLDDSETNNLLSSPSICRDSFEYLAPKEFEFAENLFFFDGPDLYGGDVCVW